MGAKFLCCLPVRLGTLVISVFQFLGSSIVSAILWYALWYYRNSDELSLRLKISTGIFAVIYTVATIMAIVGFLGTLLKKFSYIRRFSSMLSYLLGLQIIYTIIYLIIFFLEGRKNLVQNCINGSTDQRVIDSCQKLNDLSKGWVVGVVIAISLVPILIQAYGCYVVSAYAKKLAKKEMSRNMAMTQDGFKYEAARTHDDSRPLTHPDVHYPYSDTSNSFGHSGSQRV
ncbi:hypothetical protein HGRIS_002411 [Hohenbuehelia grisea]|uniref:Tetraspanin n=1 Tax=Hohenbuehelia grisea TaxID=104357 RepID=A0ABR3JL50_9AGAR